MIHISKVQLIDVSAMGLFYYLFFLFNCIRSRSFKLLKFIVWTVWVVFSLWRD
jgi:hypothetical protein